MKKVTNLLQSLFIKRAKENNTSKDESAAAKRKTSLTIEISGGNSFGVDSYGLSCVSTATNSTSINNNFSSTKKTEHSIEKKNYKNFLKRSSLSKYSTFKSALTYREISIEEINEMSIVLQPTVKQTASVWPRQDLNLKNLFVKFLKLL